jgi:hypothetical protein
MTSSPPTSTGHRIYDRSGDRPPCVPPPLRGPPQCFTMNPCCREVPALAFQGQSHPPPDADFFDLEGGQRKPRHVIWGDRFVVEYNTLDLVSFQ